MLLTLNQKTIIMLFLLICYHIKLQACWCSNIEEYSAGGERKVGGMRRESCQRDLQIFDSTEKKSRRLRWGCLRRRYWVVRIHWVVWVVKVHWVVYSSTDGPNRRGESGTWCLDCQHASTFYEVFLHFPNKYLELMFHKPFSFKHRLFQLDFDL